MLFWVTTHGAFTLLDLVVPAPLFLGSDYFFPLSLTPAGKRAFAVRSGVGTLPVASVAPRGSGACTQHRGTISTPLAERLWLPCSEVMSVLLVKQRMLSRPRDVLRRLAPLALSPPFLQYEGGGCPTWLEFARPLQPLFGQLRWKVNLSTSLSGEGCAHPHSELFSGPS